MADPILSLTELLWTPIRIPAWIAIPVGLVVGGWLLLNFVILPIWIGSAYLWKRIRRGRA